MGLNLNINVDLSSLKKTIDLIIEANRKKITDKLQGKQTKEQVEDKRQDQATFGGGTSSSPTPTGFPLPSGGNSTGGIGGYDITSTTTQGTITNVRTQEASNGSKKKKKKEDKQRAPKPGAFPKEEKGVKIGHCWLFRNRTEYSDVSVFQASGSDSPIFSSFSGQIFLGWGRGGLSSPSTAIVTGTGTNQIELGSWSAGLYAMGVPNFQQLDAQTTGYYCNVDPPFQKVCPLRRVVVGLSTVGGGNNYDDFYRCMAIPCGGENFILIYVQKYVWYNLVRTIQSGYGEYQDSPTGQCIGLGVGPCAGGYDEHVYYESNPVNGCPIDVLYQLRSSISASEQCSDSQPWSWGPYASTGGLAYHVINDEAERLVKAYICNNSIIREIEVPDKILSFVDLVFPESVKQTIVIATPSNDPWVYDQIYSSIGPGSNFPSGYIPPANGSPGYNYDLGSGLWVDFNATRFTPAVFWMLQQRIQFTTKQVKVGPNTDYKVVADPSGSSGWDAYRKYDNGTIEYYTYPSQLYNNYTELRYSTLPSDETPTWDMYDQNFAGTKPKEQKTATLKFSPNRPPQNGTEPDIDHPDRKFFGGRDELIVVWDWNDPNYCREMCLELGFSASDLTPAQPNPQA